MRCNRGLKPLFLLFVLLIAVAALAANNQSAANSGSAFRTYLQPDLTFKSVLSPEFLPQTQGTQVAFGRTCRCSCGYPCETDNDCGPGGLCERFISCCAGPSAQIFQEMTARSTRTGEHPAEAVNINCK